MMKPVERVNGIGASALDGQVILDWRKTVWMSIMISGSLLAPFYFSISALCLFLSLSYLTLLLGHSVGMHRMMIHRSFQAAPPLRRVLIFMGVLVGMGGPSNIVRVHDIRDWAQRLPDCHDFFSHRRNYFKDVCWQLFCRFEFEREPVLIVEAQLANDTYIRIFDKYWPHIQIGFALILFSIGGISWVLWGCSLRVFVCVLGHWSVTYVCHNPGPGKWHVLGAGVQASNLQLTEYLGGFLTHGECWHNNHHAFPESAQIGLEDGQFDPAWEVIKTLKKWGWVYNVGRPREKSAREDLVVK